MNNLIEGLEIFHYDGKTFLPENDRSRDHGCDGCYFLEKEMDFQIGRRCIFEKNEDQIPFCSVMNRNDKRDVIWKLEKDCKNKNKK